MVKLPKVFPPPFISLFKLKLLYLAIQFFNDKIRQKKNDCENFKVITEVKYQTLQNWLTSIFSP